MNGFRSNLRKGKTRIRAVRYAKKSFTFACSFILIKSFCIFQTLRYNFKFPSLRNPTVLVAGKHPSADSRFISSSAVYSHHDLAVWVEVSIIKHLFRNIKSNLFFIQSNSLLY